MDVDAQSQYSDEGIELPPSEPGFQFPNELTFGEDLAPDSLEAKIVYLLLPKNVPISRATRLQWLLDHLNTTISISNTKLYFFQLETSQNIEVISAIPREHTVNPKCIQFLITYRTEVRFLAYAYRFVYCLDMSPSHVNVDIHAKQVLFDQILQSFKTSIEALSKQFLIPGNSIVFQPCIYLTIMANTPFFITPAQQVILKGIQMTPHNVYEIIKCVETHFHILQGKIAEACMQALEKIENHRASHDAQSSLGGEAFEISDIGRLSKIPMVTPDVNFVNMLRYSMLAIYLLPENTLSHILVITDGIVSMPDSNVMETMLHQLHYDAIGVSFLKVGSSFHPNCGVGLVSYIDLLYFFAQSTLGTCIEYFPKIIHDPAMPMNYYQEILLLWSFHNSNCRVSSKPCDNVTSWTSINDRFYIQRLPTLLSKRQTEDSTSTSVLLLLARRMREGFTVDNIFYGNGNLEIKLIHQWKSSIFIHYKLMSQWPPTQNLTHFEVYIYAPYEFLHDMTCLIKKETKSVFRQAIIQRFWSRLSQVSSGDVILATQLSNFTSNKDWCTLPDSVKSGLPVFTSNTPFSDSAKLTLTPRDNYCLKFVNIWHGITQLETSHWRKWFHTHKISLILTHDTPLPTKLHMTSCSSQRYQVVQCRQAVVALHGMLADWSSFVLIDNHTYLKFLCTEPDKPPTGFCIIRVSSKFPSAVLNLGFSTNTPGQYRHEVCDELKSELSTLSYLPKANEPSCCVLLNKPLEKILIRYERVPNTYTTVVFPDGTQPPDSSSCFSSPVSGSLFTTLSRYLFHKRWIWSASHNTNPRLSDTSISRILNTLTRIRLKEGYHFAYSSSGIVTMVLEVWLNSNASCVVQYVLFPPYYNWGDDILSGSDEDMEPASEMEAELQMITEVWIEPQYGNVLPSNSRISYFNNKNYYEIADAICKIDFRCINILLTMEHLSLMCQNKAVHNLTAGMDVTAARTSFSKRSHSRRNEKSNPADHHKQNTSENGSPWYPIVAPRIEHIPFKFDSIGLLHLCQQTELLFSMLRIEKSNRCTKALNVNKANTLLLDNIYEHFSLLHDRELELSKKECDIFTRDVVKRHKDHFPHSCPISSKNLKSECRWRCYIKGVSITHVILTFLPASIEDLRALTTGLDSTVTANDTNDEDEKTSSGGSNVSDVPINTPYALCLPVYVYDSPLKLLVNAYVENENGHSSAPEDVYLDYRFKFANFVQTEMKEKLKGSDTESCSEETDPPTVFKNVREHCTALELTHTKCYVLSLFLALHIGIYIHSLDVQNAMDLCEEEIVEVDITDYITKICSHSQQVDNDKIYIQKLNEALPCSELHMLIKKKFFKLVCSSFNQISSNGEYYYFKDLSSQPEEKVDADDDISVCASEIEFRSERDMSIFSEGPHLLAKNVNTEIIDVAKVSDVSPLFLHFVCTLRYNNGGHSNTSVRVLPTCLGELIQTLEKPTEFLSKSNLQVTLDIFCLTLPTRVQNILSEYSQQGLRTTSLSSEGGFQRTISSTSEASMNSDVPLPLRNLTELQRKSIDKLCDEIKWLLEDEICATLLNSSEPISNDTIEYVVHHVIDGHASRASCKMEKIVLNFVFITEPSHEKFLEEFQGLTLPFGYKLYKGELFYYVAKHPVLKESQTYVNLPNIGGRSSGNSEFPLDIHDIFRGTPSNLENSYREDTMSQQSDITSGSGSGTDGGYDDDVEDEDDCEWLEHLGNKRPHLPNFWLILKVDQDLVYVYFHCRFVELNITQVDAYCEVQRAVCDAVADLCKRVNQLLLLQSLYKSKTCEPLLEPDDFSHTDIQNAKISYDDMNDDSEGMLYSRSMSEASLHLKPGYFSCPIVWEKLFVLHPRLKTGPGKSGISRGIVALKNILEKFCVVNRSNMFVYKDNEENVFYLRLYESGNITGVRLSIKPSDERTMFSRSPSIASLPIGQNNKPNLAISDQSIASIVSSDNLRPRVRSFGEKESRIFESRDSRETISEDTLILRVHGITEVGDDIQCGLVQVLQNRLDDAVLDFLSGTLARNAMCPLTPEDVRFIQKPQDPDVCICCTVQEFSLQWQKSRSFIHYLRQNLLQFLNLPKYTDSRPECHFQDFTTDRDSVILTLDNIFIYNQSQTPTSGSRGIACIVLALIDKCHPISTSERENNFETVFITKNYEDCVNSIVIEEKEIWPDSYLEFRIWKQGRINIDNLSKKLTAAISQATWDIVTEYYLLKNPLCVEEYREQAFITKKKIEIDALNLDLDKEVEYNCELDLTFDKTIRPNVKSDLPKKLDAQLFPTRKYSRRSSIHPSNLKASRVISYDVEKEISIESNENGVLSIVYSKFLPSWMEFGDSLKAPAVKKQVIKLGNRHLPNLIVKELITMLSDAPKAFRAWSTHSLNSTAEEVFVPFVHSNIVQKYVIISRGFRKWQHFEDSTSDISDEVNPQHLKHTQKFVPLIIENTLIPRRKVFWISVENDNIVIYTYNWAKEHMDKLIQNCMNLSQWLTLRSCFMNSAVAQKLGLFYNQPLTRKCFMLSNNNYYSLIGNLDAMSKFPRDHSHKKSHQSSFNLPTVLETFRDNFCNTKYTSNDAVTIFTIEMREMKSLEKKNRDEMKKLHSMYQSRTGSTSVPQLNLLMQNSRILHYVHTPLLFLPRWRLKSAATRDHSLYPSQAIQIADKFSDKERELWHFELCYSLFNEYRTYLYTLGFTPLQIDNPQQGNQGSLWVKDKSSYNSVFYIQRTILGGILIFTVSFEEPFFVTTLHAIECSRLQNITSRASVNGFTLSFLDKCDKVKILMHLHSFTYDYHLRSIYNYIFGNFGKLPEKYNVHQFLDDFMKYYNKAPNFARNLVHSDTITIEGLVTEGKQLFDYLLSNVRQYGFSVLEMDHTSPEFILVQVTTARQVSYKDSQDRQHTNDFDMTLVVYNLCTPYKPTDRVMHLKYYLILTSKRDIFPMFENEQKLGKFRTVSSTGGPSTSDKSATDLELSLPKSESNGEAERAERLADNDDKSLSRSSEDKPLSKLLATVTIMQESVNYLGYYSPHEQIMQQLILDKARSTQKDIRNMVSKGMVDCRTNLLWNRMIAPQDSTPLSFDEFIELKLLAKLTPLSQLSPNLGPLLNQPLGWYQGFAKLLPVKYVDQHRIFTSADGHLLYYVILHPRYYGAFMLMSIDLQTARGELCAVYREPNKREDADPLGIGYEKSLRDGFVKCVCFYLWSGMICG
ncbi:KICSTOR complex protein SZT2 isoform X3 [Dendroctonus ponderosae]|uniref:KICSTOR complex protein SZT2 isoform X3 n=1 Tax=Dendroctonus ponderosae TaxID=77166 RepID=UPI002035034C|nr:KICSTOR complex protein SZT2 isoform X3 [Dendroctonus ponderosae]